MGTKRTVTIVEDAAELARWAAGFFVQCAQEAVDDHGAFFVALSGGSTPRAMHRLLAQAPFRDEIAWGGVHLFWVDDRCVPHDDPASNFGAAREDFISKVSVPEDQVHAMPTTVLPEEGAKRYEKDLVRVPASPFGVPRFDVVFLGIGPDGHTASLFPRQQALEEKNGWVVAVKGGRPDVHRLTLTVPVLNGARRIVFLVSGAGKASIVKAVLDDRKGDLPAERIFPVSGRLTWLLDREASALLSNEEWDGRS